DTFFYMHSYRITNFNIQTFEFEGDFGFNLFQLLLQQLSRDPQVLIFTTALITNLLIVYVFSQYSRMFEIAIYVFITSGMYITSMNGIRQYMAAAIVFTATRYIMDGNWKKFILISLLAGTIHNTALMMIPIYF